MRRRFGGLWRHSDFLKLWGGETISLFGSQITLLALSLPRRPILIGANIGRAILLGWLPLAALLNLLRIEQLYIISFCAGTLTVFFDVAYNLHIVRK